MKSIFDKLLFLDLETSGVDKDENGVIQIAGLIDINNKVVKEFNILSNVSPTDIIEKEALAVNKRTIEEIKKFQAPTSAFSEFVHILDKYIDKYDRNDKFVFAGYNIRFDQDFIWAMSKKTEQKYFGSYVRGTSIDVMQFAIACSYMINLKILN